MNEVIKVLLVGDDESMREELYQMLGNKEAVSKGGVKLIGEARSGEEALAEAKKLSPDVILMLTDIRMSGIDTAHAINEAQLPARVVIITENLGRDLVPAIKAGVAGLLPRNIGYAELVSAIRKIYLWSWAPSCCGATQMSRVPPYFKSRCGGE